MIRSANRVRLGGVVAALVAAAALLATGAAWACVPLRAYIAVTPQLSGGAGSTVTVAGYGFSGGPIEVRWNAADGAVLARATAPDFTAPVVIPNNPDGLYSLVVLSRDKDGVVADAATSQFLVSSAAPRVAAAAASTSAVGRSSSSTSGTPAYVWVLITAVVVGGASWLSQRRRPRPSPRSTVSEEKHSA